MRNSPDLFIGVSAPAHLRLRPERSALPVSLHPDVIVIFRRLSAAIGSEAINIAVTLGSFTGGMALLTSQKGTYAVPCLAAGESQSFFWFVTFATTENDVGLYTVSATASNLFATPTAQTANITTVHRVSASSNKIDSIS